MKTIKRWYDIDPRVSEAMKAWEAMPQALQLLVAESVNLLIQVKKSQQVEEDDYSNNSVITGRQVSGIYQAGRKRRWQDQDPVIRSAWNALSIAELEEQVSVSLRILALQRLWQEHAQGDAEMSEEIAVAMLSDSVSQIFRPPL